MNHIDYFNKV